MTVKAFLAEWSEAKAEGRHLHVVRWQQRHPQKRESVRMCMRERDVTLRVRALHFHAVESFTIKPNPIHRFIEQKVIVTVT